MHLLTTIILSFLVGYTFSDILADFDDLVSIFPGVYDNYEQYKNDIAERVPIGEMHLHMTSNISVQYVPIFPDRENFYLEQYVDGNKSLMSRQKLYSFYVDSNLEIHLEIYSFVDAAKFAHAEPYSPLFKDLTKKDVVYSNGCDVFWDRVSGELFKSRMYNTCIVTVDEIKYIITDTNYLSPHYLTVNERWIFENNGSTYTFNPVPYNETKQDLRSVELRTHGDISHALMSGHSVTYSITTSNCEVRGQMSFPSVIEGRINRFEYQTAVGGYIWRFLSMEHESNMTGQTVFKVVEHIFGMSTYHVTLLTYKNDIKKSLCNFTTGALSFKEEDTRNTRITDFNTLRNEIQNGGNICFIVAFDICQSPLKVKGGGELTGLTPLKDGNVISAVPWKLPNLNFFIDGIFYLNQTSITFRSTQNIQCLFSWRSDSLQLYLRH